MVYCKFDFHAWRWTGRWQKSSGLENRPTSGMVFPKHPVFHFAPMFHFAPTYYICLCSKVFINHLDQMKASLECLNILIYWSKYWKKNHAPSYKMAPISEFSKVRPDTFWFDLATSVSIECGQSIPHFKEWFIKDGGLPQKLCGVNKTCYVVRGLWHYLRMGKIITFMKSTWNN